MNEQDRVAEFHKKNEYPVNHILSHTADNASPKADKTLQYLGRFLIWIVKRFQKLAVQFQERDHDARLYRLLLIMEEAGETALALSEGNITETADGLTDLLYVTYGTGVTYDIPLHKCFDEVHRSNMSKKKRTKEDPRMRDKGNWEPPNFERILDAHH